MNEGELIILLRRIAEALERIANQLERWDHMDTLATTTFLEDAK